MVNRFSLSAMRSTSRAWNDPDPGGQYCTGRLRQWMHGAAWLAAAGINVMSPQAACGRNAAAGSPLSGQPSLYAPWPNGPSQSATFFPIAVWWQNPAVTGKSNPYPTIGAAAAGMGINIFLGEGNWPEHFGQDDGELEAAKASGVYMVGGINTPWAQNSSAQSVASVLALAASIGAQKTVIGYNMGDEPDCAGDNNGGLGFGQIPAAVAQLESYDSTRVITFNQGIWPMQPYFLGSCGPEAIAALQAISVGSLDYYPITNAEWIWYNANYPGILPAQYFGAKSDFISVPNDTLWVQGVATQALIHAGRPNQPIWMFVESGGDDLGQSGAYNTFPGAVSAGSTILTNASGWSSFTATWLGLTVSGGGLPANTTIIAITDATHAVMSAASAGSFNRETITVTGGAGSDTDCVASANLCVVNGNAYRPTPAQIGAEVWMTLINGANGIEYFCHDSLSDFFCMGDTAGGPDAAVTQANLTKIDQTVLHFAKELNSPTTGTCSMEQVNFSTGVLSVNGSCSNGVLTMTTGDATVPGMAMVKQLGRRVLLFTQSDRRSPDGASFTYGLSGLGGKTATLLYDSDSTYDKPHSRKGASFPLNGAGQFTDVLGAYGDDYQVKIYEVE